MTGAKDACGLYGGGSLPGFPLQLAFYIELVTFARRLDTVKLLRAFFSLLSTARL